MAEPKNNYHLSPEEFRRWGYAVVDAIAAYQQNIEQFPVLSPVSPGDIRAQLPPHPPETGESFAQILQDVQEIIIPGLTHWQSPNFFAFFPSNNSAPSILAELLSAGLGVQGMLWATSPACTELETLMLDWLVEMLGLPTQFKSSSSGGGVIQDTASSATLCALLAARERATNFQSNRQGLQQNSPQKLIAYTSTQAHSSVEKAVKIAGLGEENLRLIPVDKNYAMQADILAAQIAADIQAGFTPCFVTATVGTTSSQAIDPVRKIGEICQKYRVWLHIDAAMSGTAALCPEYRFIHDGLELADSYCFNPHKWMLVNFDCDCFYVADRSILVRTLSVLPEYLKNQATASGAVFDYRDWHIPLGRRFRSLKLWFVIRHYGIEGLQFYVRKHIALAQEFAQWVQQDSRFELAAPVPLNLVCFRHRGGDVVNQKILAKLNQSGEIYLSHTKLANQFTLRTSIGQAHTEKHHVQKAWQLIQAAAE